VAALLGPHGILICAAQPREGLPRWGPMLVLTMSNDDDSVFAGMRAGARGYVLKGAEPQEIARAISAVAAGRPSSARRSPPGCWPTSPPTRAASPGVDRPGTRGPGRTGRRPNNHQIA
jgi:DNA-binding NarL/FixJ family response regulator